MHTLSQSCVADPGRGRGMTNINKEMKQQLGDWIAERDRLLEQLSRAEKDRDAFAKQIVSERLGATGKYNQLLKKWQHRGVERDQLREKLRKEEVETAKWKLKWDSYRKQLTTATDRIKLLEADIGDACIENGKIVNASLKQAARIKVLEALVATAEKACKWVCNTVYCAGGVYERFESCPDECEQKLFFKALQGEGEKS